MATASMDLDFVLVSEDESDDESYLYQNEDDDDDDEEDRTFDLINATEKAFSNLSVKKTKRRLVQYLLMILPLCFRLIF
jgi:hypothetical protein